MFIPLLVKILGAMLMGAGLLTLQHPEVAKSALPSVGIILVEHPNGTPTSGTVFVAGDHLLVTANHVAQKAGNILVRFRGSEWLEAKVVESDPINDVAVLSYFGPDIPPLPLADFGKVKPGDYVAVMAFPSVEDLRKQAQAQDAQEKAAKAQTAVEGTVRAIRGALLVITTEDVPRNGGPVLNLTGEVIGIVRGRLQVDTASWLGYGYAAPSYTIKPTLAAAELKHPSEPTASAPTTAQAGGGATPGSSQPTTSGQSQPTTSAPSQPATSEPSQPSGQAPSQPATTGPSQPAAQAPSQPAPSGTQPAVLATSQLVPSASSSAAVAPFLIVPGQSVGPVRVGRPAREETTGLGASKGSVELDDGTMMYRWFEPPSNAGIGVRTAKNDTVLRVWVLNDERYRTKEGLHVGSTEAEVRAALGVPTRVEFSSKAKTRTLIYESLGLWFSIQLDQQYNFYNAVFDIGVMARK